MIKPLKLDELQQEKDLSLLDRERLKINTLLREKYSPKGFSLIYNVEHLNHLQREQLIKNYSHFNAQLFNGQYNDEPWTFEILWFPDRK